MNSVGHLKIFLLGSCCPPHNVLWFVLVQLFLNHSKIHWLEKSTKKEKINIFLTIVLKCCLLVLFSCSDVHCLLLLHGEWFAIPSIESNLNIINVATVCYMNTTICWMQIEERQQQKWIELNEDEEGVFWVKEIHILTSTWSVW